MITGCQLYMTNCADPLKAENNTIDLIQNYPNLAFPDNTVDLKTSWMILDDAASLRGNFLLCPICPIDIRR